MSDTKVLLVDSHTRLRGVLRSLVDAQGDMEVVGEAGDALEAVREAERLQPDVVVTVITMPSLSGLEATRWITGQCPGVEVIMLTTHTAKQYVAEALAAGVLGYLVMTEAAAELASAIRCVRRGERFVSPSISWELVNED